MCTILEIKPRENLKTQEYTSTHFISDQNDDIIHHYVDSENQHAFERIKVKKASDI